MSGRGSVVKGGLGVVGGLVWFIVLAASEVHMLEALASGGAAWGAVSLVVMVSGACVLGIRGWGAAWGWGVCGGLAAGLLLGFIEGPTFLLDTWGVLSVPLIFSVGLGTVAVWGALAVSLALSATASWGRRLGRSASDAQTFDRSR